MAVDSAIGAQEIAVPTPLNLDPQSGLARLIAELEADKNQTEVARALIQLYPDLQVFINNGLGEKINDDLKGRIRSSFLEGNRAVIQSLAFNIEAKYINDMNNPSTDNVKDKFRKSKQLIFGMKNAGGYSVTKPEDWEEVLSKPAPVTQAPSPQPR